MLKKNGNEMRKKEKELKQKRDIIEEIRGNA